MPELGEAPCRLAVSGTPVAATPGTAQSIASPVADVPFDLLFLDLMIHQRALIRAGAEVASSGAEHAELANLGRSLSADAATDITQLQHWRVEWYGDVPPLTDRAIANALDRLGRARDSQGGIPGAFEILAMGNMLSDLCHAGAPFDLALANTLIPALNAELLLARFALESGVHPEVRAVAQRLIEQDQSRLDALIAWRTAWYPATPVSAATPLP